MGNFLPNNCRFSLGFAICLLTASLANGSILKQAVEPPTDPRELAEYHFNIAQAYEAWGWVGKAHLHYEIVHDSFPNSKLLQAATQRMRLLQNTARTLTFRDPDTLTFNPQTFMAINHEFSFEALRRQLYEATEDPLPSNADWSPKSLSGIPFREGSFQLLDSPFFDFKPRPESGSGALVF
jgi:hypothetical protein